MLAGKVAEVLRTIINGQCEQINIDVLPLKTRPSHPKLKETGIATIKNNIPKNINLSLILKNIKKHTHKNMCRSMCKKTYTCVCVSSKEVI